MQNNQISNFAEIQSNDGNPSFGKLSFPPELSDFQLRYDLVYNKTPRSIPLRKCVYGLTINY